MNNKVREFLILPLTFDGSFYKAIDGHKDSRSGIKVREVLPSQDKEPTYDYPETALEHYWFNKGHTSNKVYQENDYLRAQISYLREFKKQALEVIGFYSREFNTNHEGAWIGGPLYKDKLHGNDMVNMSSFAVGGKRARSFLEKYGEK